MSSSKFVGFALLKSFVKFLCVRCEIGSLSSDFMHAAFCIFMEEEFIFLKMFSKFGLIPADVMSKSGEIFN